MTRRFTAFFEKSLPPRHSEQAGRPLGSQSTVTLDASQNQPKTRDSWATPDFAEDMLEYSEGYVLVGTPSHVIFFDLDEQIRLQAINGDQARVHIDLSPDAVHTFEIEQQFRLNSLLDLGSDYAVVVLESTESHQLTFFRINFTVHEQSKAKLQLIQLGLMVNMAHEEDTSSIAKQRALCFRDRNGKFTHRLLVLRASGRINFYSDFMLVNDDLDEASPVRDIETGANEFCLIRPDATETRAVVREYQAELFRFIRTRVVESPAGIEMILHDRIAPYFNLYADFCSFKTFFLVAHRTFVSVFDIVKGQWTSMKTFPGFVRKIMIQTRPEPALRSLGLQRTQIQTELPFLRTGGTADRTKYNIMVQEGASSLHFLKIDRDGRITQTKDRELKIDGRILKARNTPRIDALFSVSLCLIVEKLPAKKLHIRDGPNLFNSFELKRGDHSAVQELQILHKNTLCALLSSGS